MIGYDAIFASLAGKHLDEFYLNIYYNLFTSFDNLAITTGNFYVEKEYATFYFHVNQITSLNGLENVIKSFVNPEGALKLSINVYDNLLTDISKMGETL